MSAERVHRTTHQVTVDAPAGVVYGLVGDAVTWPLFLPPSVHVEQLEFDGGHERLRMWVRAGGEITSWTSRRVLDPARRRIDFRHDLPAAPARTMGGTWAVEALAPDRSRLTLTHEFTVVDDDPGGRAWLERTIDTNSRAQLEQLSRLAGLWGRLDSLVLAFEDSVRVEGPAELVYDFLYRVGGWPERIPRVSRLTHCEPAPGIQVMTMDTRTPDGAGYTTESVRICFPHAGRIVYKQTATPPLMAAHTGEWTVVPDERGVTVTAHHRVLLNEDAITRELGPDADVTTARQHLRRTLGAAGTATLRLAKSYAQNAVTVL
ncbi:aromatase/cyclase [Streptomyces sp. NPDC051684]|uniref:aromatase/cyclase n=1 Tax=Streptomyces sp. NPDC051684 TaxID=3365670 RepID=UPI0037AA4C21